MSTKGVNVKKRLGMTRGLLAGLLMIAASGYSAWAQAGVALGATRVIYPAGQKQVQLGVTNNDDSSTYLIQSWVENADGGKDSRFVITPPLFAMQGKKENTLRIIDATNKQLPQDRESLFWINVKAIPSMDKSKLSENTLQLAIISRIKLYYRPVVVTSGWPFVYRMTAILSAQIRAVSRITTRKIVPTIWLHRHW